ncbi:hypothetical protein [Anaerobutyricum hallii]
MQVVGMVFQTRSRKGSNI